MSLPIDRSRVPTDVIAGVTLAALGIPEVMGYTSIAGMPVITGLYTILIPIAVFAVLGSSRHLVVGADSASAAIMAAGIAGLAPIASPHYVSIAGIVAIATGAFLLLARVVRLGFLADFLSRSVLIGFLTGVGIQVAMGQVAGMFGVPGGSDGGPIQEFIETLSQIPSQASWTTAAVSASVFIVILGLKAISPKIPGALIAVVGAIAVSWIWDLQAHGVAVLGKVPSGLPSFGIPDYGWDDLSPIIATAASIFLVVLAQSAATSRAYAAKYADRFDENLDLVGLSFANVSAGLSGTFVVNGSPTKTQMVDGAGGRSQLAQLTTAVIVLIVLLFLTVPLQYMPEAVLVVDRVPDRGGAGRHPRHVDDPSVAARRIRGRGDHGAGRRHDRRRAGHPSRDRALTPRPHPAELSPARHPVGQGGFGPVADGARPGARGGVTRDRRGARARDLSVRRDALLRERESVHRGDPQPPRSARRRPGMGMHRLRRDRRHRLLGWRDAASTCSTR